MAAAFLPGLAVPLHWHVTFRAEDGDLKEDLLQLHDRERDLLLDVGWYPDGDPSGQFAVYLFKGDFHGEKLVEVQTSDRAELLATLQVLLLNVP